MYSKFKINTVNIIYDWFLVLNSYFTVNQKFYK